MIQEILTGVVLAGVALYLVWKIRKAGAGSNGPCGGCTATGCDGCPAIDLKAEAERRKALRENFSSDHHFEKKMT